MYNKYFDFEKMYNEVIKPLTDNWEQYIEDNEVQLDCVTKVEVVDFLNSMPFEIDLDSCEIDFDHNSILFMFSESYDESTESSSYVSYCSVYIIYSIMEDAITTIGYEQG